jgi:Cu(I)/Ag(I) efflux system membrane fusion protein
MNKPAPTHKLKFTFLILIGMAIGGLSLHLIHTFGLLNLVKQTSTLEVQVMAEKKPLYWVAPMDDNYRKSEPGLSPMGMDLVPVYPQEQDDILEIGTVKISPSVENNLGVRTEKVKFGALQSTVEALGYVGYNEEKLIHIHPRVEGWVESLSVIAEGDTIKKGQEIFQLYSPELVNAQEEYILALNDQDRRLIKASENRLAALHISEKTIKAIKRTRKSEQNIKFYATQSGVVENLVIRKGFFVQPGTTMLSIGDLSEVWVEAEIFERQASFVEQGNKVTMTLDYLPGKTWQGEVDYIYPTLDAQKRTVRVRLRFENTDLALKPNMFSQVKIYGKESENTLVIAKEALIRTGEQDRVVVALGEGRFKSVAVQVGRSDAKYIEILEGLTLEDTIVTSAQFLLDSESSKNSDFKRMSAVQSNNEHAHSQGDSQAKAMSGLKVAGLEMEGSDSRARVTGKINAIDKSNRVINISREAIEKWQRAAATLDFIIADSLELEPFVIGYEIDFTFEAKNGDFTVIEVHKIFGIENGKMEMKSSAGSVVGGGQ